MDEESHCRARFSASQTGSSYSRREKSWTFSVAVSAATENDERRGSAGEEARFFGRDLNATREKVSTQPRDLSSCENFDWIHFFFFSLSLCLFLLCTIVSDYFVFILFLCHIFLHFSSHLNIYFQQFPIHTFFFALHLSLCLYSKHVLLVQ